ncbi:MAG: hypothetical protein AB8B50_03975 [Pirellulaceae bacterium]
MTMNSNNQPQLYAYQVSDSDAGKSFWTRIGAAWPTKDGGYSLQLEAIPLGGRIILSPPKANQ